MVDRQSKPNAGSEDRMGEFVRWNALAASASEFVVAVLLGAGLGYGVDWLAGTYPWGLIAGVGFGFAVGLYMLMRVARKAFKD